MAGNASLCRRWFDEVWNEGREETINEMCAKDVVGYGQAQHGVEIHGVEQFKQLWSGLRGSFSNVHIEIHDTIEQDDRVVARWTMAMTHTGDFLGIAPTAKRVSMNGISIQRFVDGQIVTGWDNWDQLSLLVQLGSVPEHKFL
jgi:steroid delta-isomerase-like uncharacterized protein